MLLLIANSFPRVNKIVRECKAHIIFFLHQTLIQAQNSKIATIES